MLTADIDISPMVIDGSWGTGKTEFCHKLINLMKEQEDGPDIVYIDAFKADHADEPLLTIIAEVLKLVPDTERDGVMQKILPAVRFGLKTSAKAALGHLLRQDTTDIVDDFEKEIKQVADKAIDASVESLLKDHVKANKNLQALQTTLEEIASEKPIVLFIDELDRCRPDFAVDMLETIKHTFDVPGIQFVLITNTTQLKASINHIYGESIDAHRYLDKFLKFTFKLPHQVKKNQHTKIQASIAHYRNWIDQNPIFGETQLKDDPALDLVNRIIEVNQLSLREIETLVRHLEIYQRLTDNKGLAKNITFGYMLLRLLGISLFSIKPELANSIVIGQADAKELGYFLGDNKIVALTEDH
ncbi:MAG: KAP family NTPase, partial [Thiotrichaceae bacterium]|nr:KAP family NTPase [Thiotrichaceae bacterium]